MGLGGLLNFPNVVCLEEFGKRVILLLGLHLFYLCFNCIIISGSIYIADHTQGYREAIAIAHQGKFQLQGIVLAFGVVNKNIVNGNAILANFNNLQSETFLGKSILVVLSENQRLTMLYIDSVLGTTCLVVDAIMGSMIKDDTILHNFAHRSTLMIVSGLQNLYSAHGISGHSTSKEVSACAET